MEARNPKKSRTGLKVISVVLAVLLWIYIGNQGGTSTRQDTVEVNLQYLHLGEGLSIEKAPKTVYVKLWGAYSERGTIIVLSSEPTGYCMRIALNSYPSEKKSVIEIFPDIKNNISEDLSKMLLDEIKATIIRSQSITMLNN